MKKPLVAIVGRPNTGKSTFFNKIVGKRISIVDNTPGVTRDRIYADAEWCGHVFTLIDTGGLDNKSADVFQKNIRSQAQIAIDLADVILFIVDGREGITPADQEVADLLRKNKKNVILVVNKLDNFEVENSYEFYKLGIGDPYPISCEQSKGLGEVLDAIISFFDNKNAFNEDENDIIKIAVVGKPNAGKSSIVNKILGEDRVSVSDIAGTTRDAIDTHFKYMDKDYTLIDTAGMRRQRSVEKVSVEGYSVIRAMEAIKRADVVLIVFDASEEISEQDVRIAGYVHEEGKPSLILMNKWDLVEKDGHTINEYKKILESKLSFMDYSKPLFVSALTGKRVEKTMPSILEVIENNRRRISTGTLNDVIQKAILSQEPPSYKGKTLKILYSTQAETCPPTFIIFVNNSNLVHFSYERFLINRIREAINFEGTPIRLVFKNRKEND
ncbi:MAG: ribosome biogenesis GTPase Der [Clostridia bacterium]|nr:ribosome biogenesis GTPase Der [Clostridia bacterium]